MQRCPGLRDFRVDLGTSSCLASACRSAQFRICITYALALNELFIIDQLKIGVMPNSYFEDMTNHTTDITCIGVANGYSDCLWSHWTICVTKKCKFLSDVFENIFKKKRQ